MTQTNKPKLLDPITGLMAVLNLFGYSIVSHVESNGSTRLIIVSILIAVTFWVLYKFNKGFNWARKLVLFTSIIALLNLFVIMNYNLIGQVVILVEAVLAMFLLYWLNIEKVKNYFIGEKK